MTMTHHQNLSATATTQLLPVSNAITPYWRTELHELDEVRTGPVPKETDIVIIGAGFAGVTTAYYLLQDGELSPSARVLILDARQLCSGATARNGGHSKVKTPTLFKVIGDLGPEAAEELAIYTNNIAYEVKQIVEEEELECEFELRRSFDVSISTNALKAKFDEARKEGQKWTKNVSFIGEEFAERITSTKDAKSAFNVPAFSFWPYKFVTQLLARSLARHPERLNVQTNTPVTSVSQNDDGSNIITTPRGIIKCGKVIFATNAYTAGLLPDFEDVIVPVKGMCSHHSTPKPVHPHLINTYNIDFGPDMHVDYLNPRPDGGIVVGGGQSTFRDQKDLWFGNFDDSQPMPSYATSYWDNYMPRTFLGWEDSESKVDRVWVGIMGYTSDGWPHVGRVPGRKRQWVLAGFNGGGMALILPVSKAVARMVMEDKGFDDVRKDIGVPRWFGTSLDRLEKKFAKGEVEKR